MNFQDAMKNYFKSKLGITSGSYAEVASKYWQARLSGDIGDVGIEDVEGLSNALSSLESRIEALEPE